eukprot:3442409-Pleurochrysis_carterae.AAC.1
MSAPQQESEGRATHMDARQRQQRRRVSPLPLPSFLPPPPAARTNGACKSTRSPSSARKPE